MIILQRIRTSFLPILIGLSMVACPQKPSSEAVVGQRQVLPLRASKMEVFKSGELLGTYKFTYNEQGQVTASSLDDESFLTRSFDDRGTISAENLQAGLLRQLNVNAQGDVIDEKLFRANGELQSAHEVTYTYRTQGDGQSRVEQKISKITNSDGSTETETTDYTYLHDNGVIKVGSAVASVEIDGELQGEQITTKFTYSSLGDLQEVTSTSGYHMKIDTKSAAKTRHYLVDSGKDGEVDSVAVVTYEEGICQPPAKVYSPEQPTPSECSEAF